MIIKKKSYRISSKNSAPLIIQHPFAQFMSILSIITNISANAIIISQCLISNYSTFGTSVDATQLQMESSAKRRKITDFFQKHSSSDSSAPEMPHFLTRFEPTSVPRRRCSFGRPCRVPTQSVSQNETQTSSVSIMSVVGFMQNYEAVSNMGVPHSLISMVATYSCLDSKPHHLHTYVFNL